jgi:hypothetical protein
MLKKLFPLLLLPCFLLAKEDKPLKEGNFSLKTSQQPGPLVSFGENIVNKGDVALFLFADAIVGKRDYTTEVIPSILWGLRDNLSLFVGIPIAPRNKEFENHSEGLGDFFSQLEWAYYNKSTKHSFTQATLVGNITFPSGSATKDPNTGFGSVGFFIGATLNYSTINWMVFTSYGATLTTTRHKTKFGDQIFYEFGIERYLPSPCGWIFALMLEIDGVYAWKDRIKGRTDPDSGGNIVYFTPSIWISSEHLIFQLGAGPVVQHLYGHQSKKFLSADFNLGYTF